MKRSYLLALLFLLSACASGSIFGNSSSDKVLPEKQTQADAQSPRPDYVPYQQIRRRQATPKQIYTLLASRTTNKMLKATAAGYAGASLYISAPVVEGSAAVPEHPEYAETVTKEIVAGAHAYTLVSDKSAADYALDIFIRGSSVPSRGTELVIYKIVLKGKQQNEIGSWTEILSPIINDDKSWW